MAISKKDKEIIDETFNDSPVEEQTKEVVEEKPKKLFPKKEGGTRLS